MFEKWLDHFFDENKKYKSNAYQNSTYDAYFVLEMDTAEVVGCGGFYISDEPREARLAWGMIDRSYHLCGLGKQLFLFRKKEIQDKWPNLKITLGTSQHTFPFYQKMGMSVVKFFKAGYGPYLDRYDMEFEIEQMR